MFPRRFERQIRDHHLLCRQLPATLMWHIAWRHGLTAEPCVPTNWIPYIRVRIVPPSERTFSEAKLLDLYHKNRQWTFCFSIFE
jgi:hypothetical protein